MRSSTADALLADRVDEFSDLVIHCDAAAAVAYVEQVRDEGISLQALVRNLLAPTARRLGNRWDDDLCDFVDVTCAVAQLQEFVRAGFTRSTQGPVCSRHALLAPLPGEQHTFGISVLRAQFLGEGWQVWWAAPQSLLEIVELVEGQGFDLLCLSASVVHEPQRLAADVQLIRKKARNKGMAIFVGGHAFLKQPHLVAAVGADGTAQDGREAARRMTKWIAAR